MGLGLAVWASWVYPRIPLVKRRTALDRLYDTLKGERVCQ